jgi:hypothetical protein
MGMQRKREFGQLWDPAVPRSTIHWLMGRVHVGTSDIEVEADIRKRLKRNPDATPRVVDQCIAYALACHRANQSLYRRVVSGRIA